MIVKKFLNRFRIYRMINYNQKKIKNNYNKNNQMLRKNYQNQTLMILNIKLKNQNQINYKNNKTKQIKAFKKTLDHLK